MMDSDCELQARMAMEDEVAPESYYLQKFKLYETQSNFYMIGADKSRTYWRVIKIGRLDPNELIIHEDPTIYSEAECYDLLGRVHEGNKPSGGLKFVTTCYGIIGFVKFLGPYYMLLITKRKKIGAIGSHAVYTVAKSAMIPLSNSTVWSNVVYSKNEKRSFVHSMYKCTMPVVLLKEVRPVFHVLVYREEQIIFCCSIFGI